VPFIVTSPFFVFQMPLVRASNDFAPAEMNQSKVTW
jgi:hypothetical protein